MTYLAPRQGLFAIIVFTSFCLHCLLMVVGSENQIDETRQQKGERIVAQLVDDSLIALSYQDRVSLGVMANRFSNEADIALLQIKDANEQILVQIGDAPLQKGDVISAFAKNEDAVIGEVLVTMKQIGKGEVFKSLWPYILGALLLHFLVWLAYGYVARPTKEQLRELSRDVHEHYRNYYSQAENTDVQTQTDVAELTNGNDDILTHLATEEESDKTGNDVLQQHNIGQELDDLIQQNQLNDETTMSMAMSNTTDRDHAFEQESPLITDEEPVDEAEENNHINVHIQFVDENKLLEVVSADYLYPYLDLCSQLLVSAVDEVIKQPILHGLELVNEPSFDKNGAFVELKSDTEHSNIALGGAMLAILYTKLNHVVYQKNLELSNLALPVKVGISQNLTADTLQDALKHEAVENDVLMMVSSAAYEEVDAYMQLMPLSDSNNSYAKNMVLVTEDDESICTRINKMQSSVLMLGS
ncbi:hypothetical protein VH441_09350 [Psychrobacter sp. HD31]|uniref:hypothetical protein n=1 Tax=Psychrobacter sp. HD31 TaxID=3112003 RepID=UPI003DA29729